MRPCSGISITSLAGSGLARGGVSATTASLAGVVLAGAVQDFLVLFISTRRDGRSLGEIAKQELGPRAGVIVSGRPSAAMQQRHIEHREEVGRCVAGIDHERLTFEFQGRDFRLTDVHGHVVEDLIA